MNSVFDQAYGVLGDIRSVNGLLDQVQTVLDVDVNVPSISANITVNSVNLSPVHKYYSRSMPVLQQGPPNAVEYTCMYSLKITSVMCES